MGKSLNTPCARVTQRQAVRARTALHTLPLLVMRCRARPHAHHADSCVSTWAACCRHARALARPRRTSIWSPHHLTVTGLMKSGQCDAPGHSCRTPQSPRQALLVLQGLLTLSRA